MYYIYRGTSVIQKFPYESGRYYDDLKNQPGYLILIIYRRINAKKIRSDSFCFDIRSLFTLQGS